MNEKTTGYILLIVGIVLMLLAMISVYLVFTKQMQPVQVISGPGISLDPNQLLGNALPTGAPSTTKILPKQEIISGELINETSNLFIHLFLMGFVASIGYRLSTLGVQMVRPVVVKLKAKDGTEYEADKLAK